MLNLSVLSLNARRKVPRSAHNPTLSWQTRGLIGKNGSGESGEGAVLRDTAILCRSAPVCDTFL